MYYKSLFFRFNQQLWKLSFFDSGFIESFLIYSSRRFFIANFFSSAIERRPFLNHSKSYLFVLIIDFSLLSESFLVHRKHVSILQFLWSSFLGVNDLV